MLQDSVSLDVKESLPPARKKGLAHSIIPRTKKSPLEEANQFINNIQEIVSSQEKSEKSYSSKKGIFLDIQGLIKEGTFQEDDQIFCK